LIKQSPSAQSTIGSPSNVFIEQQLTAVQENIQQTEQELIEAQDELGKLNSARQIAVPKKKLLPCRQNSPHYRTITQNC
jgi:hypothetical protein